MLAATIDEQLEEGAMKIKHWVASLAAAGVLVGGGVTAATLVAPSAGAQDSIPGVEAAPTAAPGDAHHPLRQALDGLVANGTLTKDQAGKVYDALVAQATANRQERKQERQQWVQAVASAVGTTPDQLKSDLKAGQTLAQVGQANGKGRQDVIDGLTAAAKARLDQAVTKGTITQDQENQILQRVTERLGTVVDQPHPGIRALHVLRQHRRAVTANGNGSTTSTTAGTTSTTGG
jgi:polyhydroxyalkanoate synthesis regulator phasin